MKAVSFSANVDAVASVVTTGACATRRRSRVVDRFNTHDRSASNPRTLPPTFQLLVTPLFNTYRMRRDLITFPGECSSVLSLITY